MIPQWRWLLKSLLLGMSWSPSLAGGPLLLALKPFKKLSLLKVGRTTLPEDSSVHLEVENILSHLFLSIPGFARRSLFNTYFAVLALMTALAVKSDSSPENPNLSLCRSQWAFESMLSLVINERQQPLHLLHIFTGQSYLVSRGD